jgi:hypothetical protein
VTDQCRSNLGLPSFTVTPKSQGGLTFSPTSVTFDNTNIHRYLAVQATNLFHKVFTFKIIGISGVFGTVTIIKQIVMSVLSRLVA